ncbi:MAG: ComEC/Rec2 family competence protein [Candidatus Omnitrophica bacterium]|nr:ComEC/Rec2 family competence protein [Candidatus Omnitrophota bacterium]MDD5237497.1 ComEC/Rec2 family competence protein [Candidatus Omnitrophota bacterium]
MKSPLVILTLNFIFGILTAGIVKINFLSAFFLSGLFLISASFSLKKEFFYNFSLSLCLIFLGSCAYINTCVFPRCHISRFLYYKNNSQTIRGIVNNEPVTRGNKTSFIFRVTGIKLGRYQYNCCGDILVYLKNKKFLRYGEELILRGNLYRPFASSSYKNYLSNQGIFFIMRINSGFDLVRLNKNKGSIFYRVALRLKEKAGDIISRHCNSLTCAVLEAMLLGEKRNVPRLIYNSMMKSGTVHILVVSGFNVGIVAFIIVLMLKLIRVPKKPRYTLAIPLLILYCFVTGASTPVVRATVMAIVFLLGALLRREADIYNSCAIAAIFILMINPRQIFDIGFQLSFSSVISIVYLYPKIKSLLRIDGLKIKSLKIIIEGALVSLSAWLGTLGLVAYYFRIFSPITVVANLFILPLSILITLCGFSLLVMDLTLTQLAPLFASTAELAVTLLIKVNYLLLKPPGACLHL